MERPIINKSIPRIFTLIIIKVAFISPKWSLKLPIINLETIFPIIPADNKIAHEVKGKPNDSP